MNKKVSTLLTASLLMAGPVFGSIFAQELATSYTAIKDADPKKQYVLVATHYYNGGVIDKNGADTYVTAVKEADKWSFRLAETGKGAGKKVIWTVKSTTNTSGDKEYTFSSSAYGNLKVSYKVTEGSNEVTKTQEVFGFKDESSNGTYEKIGSLVWGKNQSSDYDYYLGAEPTEEIGVYKLAATNGLSDNKPNYFQLQEVIDDEQTDIELNDLYNKKGFNFTAGKDVKENLFEGTNRIIAVDVDTDGHKWATSDANGKDLIIPAGTYFFTDLVLKKGATPENDGTYAPENINWDESTIIYASAVETVEGTINDRDKGQGFILKTAKVSEFIYEENTSEYKVADLPIHNASFDAKYNNVDKYAVRVPSFFYKEKKGDAADKKLKKADRGVDLVVLELTDDTKWLATAPAGADVDWTFKMSDSSVKDGKDLLNESKKAAVYNIQFVDGLKEDASLMKKYLTVGVDTDDQEVATGSGFVWVAKGSDIINLNHPSAQYTITKVEQEDPTDEDSKYVNVTFTNRETNEDFTVKLFPEASVGEDCYSVAFVGEGMQVQPVDVKSNGYEVVKSDGSKVSIDENVIIRLKPVAEVDEFAGFLNVEDKSIRTIRFARDKFDTSFQWFAGVAKDDNEDFTLTVDYNDIFVEEAFDAAQFQLVKSEDPVTIDRVFVYENTTAKDVDDTKGDKLSAYTYKLRYINDGSETDFYLKDHYGATLEEKTDIDDAESFLIKENADGSVSLINVNDNVFANDLKVAVAGRNMSVDATVDTKSGVVSYIRYDQNKSKENRAAVYGYTSTAKNLKTYLDAEIPNLSWKAEDGHVTLRNHSNGVVGNYIEMNENREGILVENAGDALYLHVTDENAVVPSFFISKGMGEGSNAMSERMYMFNPIDSVDYQVNQEYDPNYQLAKKATKAIFKSAEMTEDRDQIKTWIKGENRFIAEKADNEGVWAGLNRFKFQIIETEDGDSDYYIRQANGSGEFNATSGELELTGKTVYLASNNEKLYFTEDKDMAMTIHVESVAAPTSNESVSASEVKVVANNGSINVKNAAGKNVVVSTILGQVVANEVLTSDNATINVPAGIVVVAVEGESFKVNVK